MYINACKRYARLSHSPLEVSRLFCMHSQRPRFQSASHTDNMPSDCHFHIAEPRLIQAPLPTEHCPAQFPVGFKCLSPFISFPSPLFSIPPPIGRAHV